MPLRLMQRRYPGRAVHHQNWIYDSICAGKCLDPAGFVLGDA